MGEKSAFLTVYDYGMGGVWLIIMARSALEISERYPELKPVTERPSWMTQADYDRIASSMTFDIDDPPSGWLADLVKDRGR